MSVKSFLPENLYRRVYWVTHTDSVDGSLEALCSSGHVELASILVTAISGWDPRNTFSPNPSGSRLVSCNVYRAGGGDWLVVVFAFTVEDALDYSCIVVESVTKTGYMLLRPCTKTEYDEYIPRAERAEKPRAEVVHVEIPLRRERGARRRAVERRIEEGVEGESGSEEQGTPDLPVGGTR